MMIVTKNPVLVAIYMLGVFLASGLSLFVLNLDFMGFTILVVYLGAISVLFIFVVMTLKHVKSDDKEFYLTKYHIIVLFLFTLFYLYVLVLTLNVEGLFAYERVEVAQNDLRTFYEIRDKGIEAIGQHLYTEHGGVVIILAILLLLAMVAAVDLVRTAFIFKKIKDVEVPLKKQNNRSFKLRK